MKIAMKKKIFCIVKIELINLKKNQDHLLVREALRDAAVDPEHPHEHLHVCPRPALRLS